MAKPLDVKGLNWNDLFFQEWLYTKIKYYFKLHLRIHCFRNGCTPFAEVFVGEDRILTTSQEYEKIRYFT